MSLSRTSAVLLRTHLRPSVGTAPLRSQTRFRSHLNQGGDLGGPGGQKPPPANPGGPEAIKRNWLPIGGAVLTVLAGVWYLGPSSSPSKQAIRSKEADLKAAASTEIGRLPPPRGSPIAKHFEDNLKDDLKDKESKALGELSGRKGKGGMGGFRAE
ncbi:hypothetical protein G7046_g4876 [Stylonectria norvegica]|nr:hypothetical protein G7046_g4876 [Stylonectria norvegica]